MRTHPTRQGTSPTLTELLTAAGQAHAGCGDVTDTSIRPTLSTHLLPR